MAFGFAADARLDTRTAIVTAITNAACGHEICDHCLQWTRENVQAMIEAENDDANSSSEPSSPSEQEVWDSEKSDSDAVDVD